MSIAFIGNTLSSSLKVTISTTTITTATYNIGDTTAAVSITVSGGKGTYSYSWSQSGIALTINNPSTSSTTFTSLGTSGTTYAICKVTDTTTGATAPSQACTLNWGTAPQSVVISGGVTFNNTAQAPTLTSTPTTPAATTSNTFTNAGTYYSSNMTITLGLGYYLGTFSGSMNIPKATITVSAARLLQTTTYRIRISGLSGQICNMYGDTSGTSSGTIGYISTVTLNGAPLEVTTWDLAEGVAYFYANYNGKAYNTGDYNSNLTTPAVFSLGP